MLVTFKLRFLKSSFQRKGSVL